MAASVAVVWLLIAPIGYATLGTDGVLQSAMAGGLSLCAALFALVLGSFFHGSAAAMCGMVTGMFARMSVALVVVAAAQQGVALLAGSALVLDLVIFYLATLAVETSLLVARVQLESARSVAALPKAV
ncbi:MAG TPA: hypothetical protein VMF30_00575 [Pirellulales bacterium]|nr:hypothetical protein [Pirellulales bacterium]